MGFRFHKSFRLLPGVRANISKSGPSLSLGGRGLSFNFGRRGTRTTASLPGTGLSYSTQKKSGSKGGLLAILVGIGAALFGLVKLGLPGHDTAPVVAPSVASAPAEVVSVAKSKTAVVAPELHACQAAVHAVRAAVMVPGKVHFYDCRRSPQAFTITPEKAGRFEVKSTLRAEDASGGLTTRHWSATVGPNGAVTGIAHD